MTGVQPPSVARRSRAVALLVVTVLLLGTLLSGCARVLAALAVQPDDTVTGELVVATPAKSADDKGPTVTLPPDLAPLVDVTAVPAGRLHGHGAALLPADVRPDGRAHPRDHPGERARPVQPAARGRPGAGHRR